MIWRRCRHEWTMDFGNTAADWPPGTTGPAIVAFVCSRCGLRSSRNIIVHT